MTAKSYHERRVQEVQQQETLAPNGTDLLDPIIKEIIEGKYSELKIHLKTRDGIELDFQYPPKPISLDLTKFVG